MHCIMHDCWDRLYTDTSLQGCARKLQSHPYVSLPVRTCTVTRGSSVHGSPYPAASPKVPKVLVRLPARSGPEHPSPAEGRGRWPVSTPHLRPDWSGAPGRDPGPEPADHGSALNLNGPATD